MPRLLLVDDNKSIHKIAETLLAPTDIDLVCTESGKEALSLIEKGEIFDAALIDIAMSEMDGWQLLDRFRQSPKTALLPITLMAGVLDTVDPTRIANAPIQGFLKKPIELRDLGERIHRLMESRVAAQVQEPSVPDLPVPELLAPAQLAPEMALVKEMELPEPMLQTPALVDAGVVTAASMLEASEFDVSGLEIPELGDVPARPEAASDLLFLNETDLWPEDKASDVHTEELSPLAELPHEDGLELEDLDLDELRHLTPPALETGIQVIQTPSHPELSPEAIEAASRPTLSLEAYEDAITRDFPDLGPGMENPLSDSEISVMDTVIPAVVTEFPSPLLSEASLPDLDMESIRNATPITTAEAFESEVETLAAQPTPVIPELDTIEVTLAAPTEAISSRESIPDTEVLRLSQGNLPLAGTPEPSISIPMALGVPLVAGPAAVAAGYIQPEANGQNVDAQAIVQAILADPKLVQTLAKAVVGHLSQETLREIAWEIMPDLAEKMQHS